jgi:hypothetical protein
VQRCRHQQPDRTAGDLAAVVGCREAWQEQQGVMNEHDDGGDAAETIQGGEAGGVHLGPYRGVEPSDRIVGIREDTNPGMCAGFQHMWTDDLPCARRAGLASSG